MGAQSQVWPSRNDSKPLTILHVNANSPESPDESAAKLQLLIDFKQVQNNPFREPTPYFGAKALNSVQVRDAIRCSESLASTYIALTPVGFRKRRGKWWSAQAEDCALRGLYYYRGELRLCLGGSRHHHQCCPFGRGNINQLVLYRTGDIGIGTASPDSR